MSGERQKPVKPKTRVARAAGGAGPGASGGGGAEPEQKRDGGSVGKGALAAAPAVAMPLARAPRVTKPGDAEEVEADKAAARIAVDKPTGPMEEAKPAAARKLDTESPPPVEQIPVATAAKTPADETKTPVARAPVDEQAPPRAAPAPVTGAIAAPGQGRPLAPSTREAIERRMPVDLRGVRVHDDSAAQDAARAIDARAFTHGRDVWLGHGESDRDVGLMAHEAAHVAQQHDGSVTPKKGDKSGKGDKPKGPMIDRWPETPDEKGAPGFIDPGTKTLRIAVMQVPDFKKPFSDKPDFTTRPPRSDKQRDAWDNSFDDGDLAKLIPADAKPLKVQDVAEPIYFLKPRNGTNTYVIGNQKTVLKRARRPGWTKEGKPHAFHVDHQREYQIGGLDLDPANLWLLDAEANTSSGSMIDKEINKKIAALVDAAPDTLRDKPEAEAVRDTYKTVTADRLIAHKRYAGKPGLTYNRDDIATGKSLKALESVPADKARSLGAKPGEIALFDRKEGGRLRTFQLKGEVGVLKEGSISKTVEVLSIRYSPDSKTGEVTAVLFNRVKHVEPITVEAIPIKPIEGITYGGYVDSNLLRERLNDQLKIKALSAVTMDEVDFDWTEGIVAHGGLTPSIPLLNKLRLELRIDGKGLYLRRVFSGSELKFPGPVKVLGSSLEVCFGTAGFGLEGRVPFVIEGFGTGLIEAHAEVGGDGPTFALMGSLDLDTELFDKATVTVRYRDNRFSGDGVLEIGPKKIKGIKSATIKAAIDEDRIEAKGDVVVDIPGVESGSVSLVYDKVTGLEVSGKLALSDKIPALKSGTIALTLRKKPDGPYAVSGGIEATAGVPGITATITGRYEDGAFEVSGTVGYERGMLKGTVSLGATNRPVGEDGKPAGEPTGKLSAYGRGEVTVRLAKWLQGTVGLQVLANGQIVVSGKIALPSTLDIFDEKKLSKRIFSIGLDIPIVGFSVLGQRVGIFATIGGGLDAEAAIGPGQVRKAELGVTYNPDDEAATHVTGGAQLYVPAHAGLRLFVKGGVGAGIPVVSATVGLEVGATLGLDAALESDLQVDWTPSKGLVLDDKLSAYVQPKFTFDLTAFAEVTVDYLFGSSTLYDERWKLAQFEYGSNLRFGVKFPVHYEEGKEFDVALSDVEFEYPQIDPGELLKGLVKSIV